MKDGFLQLFVIIAFSLILCCCTKGKIDTGRENPGLSGPGTEEDEIDAGENSGGRDIPGELPGTVNTTLDELNKNDPGIYEVIIRDFNNDQQDDLFIVYMADDDEYDHYPVYALYSKADGKWKLIHSFEDKRYTYIGAFINIADYILLKNKYDNDIIDGMIRLHRNKVFFTIHPPGRTGCLLIYVTDEIKVVGEIEYFSFIFIDVAKPDSLFLVIERFETTYRDSLFNGIYKEYYGYELNANLDSTRLNQLPENILNDLYTHYKTGFLRTRRIADLRDFFWFLHENMPDSITDGWIEYYFQMVSENQDYLFLKEAMGKRLVLNDQEFREYLTAKKIDIFIE